MLLDAGPSRRGCRLQGHLGLSLGICAAQQIIANSAAENHTYSLPHSFCGSGVWARFSAQSPQTVIKGSAGLAEVSCRTEVAVASRAAGWAAQFPEMLSAPCHVPLHRTASHIMAAGFFEAMEARQLHSWLSSPPPPQASILTCSPAHLPTSGDPPPQACREGWTLF